MPREQTVPPRILLVEDNPDDVLLLEDVLGRPCERAFALEVAETLVKALRRLAHERFDAVLLDLDLPDAGGLVAVQRVVAHHPDVPIVVLTGIDDDLVAVEAVRAGAQDFLMKGPMERRMLERTVRHAIERKRGQKESVLSGLDRFPVGVVLLNEEGRMVLTNSAATRSWPIRTALPSRKDICARRPAAKPRGFTRTS